MSKSIEERMRDEAGLAHTFVFGELAVPLDAAIEIAQSALAEAARERGEAEAAAKMYAERTLKAEDRQAKAEQERDEARAEAEKARHVLTCARSWLMVDNDPHAANLITAIEALINGAGASAGESQP